MSSTTVLKSGSSTDPTADILLLHLWRFNLSTGTVTESMLDIESLYLNLQMTGIISTKSTHGEEDGEDPELDELFENPEAEENKTNRNRYQYWDSQQEIQSTSASITEDSRKILQTSLKLAEVFHPDKVQDSETHKSHTEIMK
jgi:hypothetical protein